MGAEARVAVTLAGTRPLSIHRYVLLPESFRRTDRARQDVLETAGVIAACVLLLALLAGALTLQRRDPRVELATDRRVEGRRFTLGALIALATWYVLGVLQNRPSHLATYDTATPWSTFQTTLTLGTLAASLVAFIVVALWYIAGGLRRRGGLPLWPPAAAGNEGGGRDMLLAGGALGLLFPVVAAAGTIGSERDPVTPSTVLHELAPLAARLFEVGDAVLLALPAVGIVAAVCANAARTTPRLIALFGFLVSTLVPLVILTRADSGVIESALVAAGLIAVTSGAVALWGRSSAAAWVVAALVAASAGQVVELLRAATPTDRAAAAIAALAAILAVAGLWAAAKFTPGSRTPTPDPAPVPNG